ncbi:radical SAM protein [Lentisphaerota bacterium ZTH]|nr:radical SAM protein [Lentisphaerota bacterium]WET06486.1 radical SAM protein [Lentisphaerota bacterium ZTH]
MPKYKEPLFRPPAEADSMIFQVSHGCPHNTCCFCGMYKGIPHSIRSQEEVLAEFEEYAEIYPQTRRIFLADGDVMALPFETLRMYLDHLNTVFPFLARVNVYSNGSSILQKSASQLRELRKLKLTTLYMGLESGAQQLLDLVNKKENVRDMIKAVNLAQDEGFRCSVMILIGLGGRKFSSLHAVNTALALNAMQPRLLSALRFVEVPNTTMFDEYETLPEYDGVIELRRIISRLELNKTVFRANHTSNPVPLEGRFPHDKEKLISILTEQLESGQLDHKGPGITPLFL